MARIALLAVAVVSFTGLLSDRSSAADLTTTTLRPLADAAVSKKAPRRNTGRAHTLQVGPSGRDRAYLRFPGPPVGVPMRSATLRLYARSARNARIDVYALSAGTWTERGLRYRNAPRGGKLVARGRTVRRGKVDVKLRVAGLRFDTQPLVLAVAARRGTVTLSAREVRSRAARLITKFADDAAPTIAAAGDIACPPGQPTDATHCQQLATSDLLVNGGFGRVLALGDNQYPGGTFAEFRASYNPTWGRVKRITSPIVGNHEYSTAYPPPAGSTADGYWDFFDGIGKQNGPAGHRGQGWYSYDVGSWHVIALNSMCDLAGGCGPGSPQETWLRKDLAAHPAACTLAYMHYPRYSSGNSPDANHTEVAPLWNDLVVAGADVMLSGHQHGYERFAPMDGAGNLVPTGLTEFVVGSGGEDFHGFNPPELGSQVINANTFGVLKLTLHAAGYDWQFLPIAGSTFTDSGSASCH